MFALFAGDTYYPSGGWKDLVGVFSTVEAAKATVAKNHDQLVDMCGSGYDWYHIVDLTTSEIVVEYHSA